MQSYGNFCWMLQLTPYTDAYTERKAEWIDSVNWRQHYQPTLLHRSQLSFLSFSQNPGRYSNGRIKPSHTYRTDLRSFANRSFRRDSPTSYAARAKFEFTNQIPHFEGSPNVRGNRRSKGIQLK